jgi:hypothetical protein
MTITTTIRFAAAGLIAAAALSPVALAGGEPKNDWPFMRSVTDRVPAQLQQTVSEAVIAVGEPKNQLPFTRPIGGSAVSQVARPTDLSGVGNAEAKNQQPFTQPVLEPSVLVSSSDGFDWGDAGIGVAAGLGFAATLAGALLLMAHRGPRGRKIGAAATR